MGYYFSFGLLGIALGGSLYYWFFNNTALNPYALWVAAWSVSTFVMYGLDKGFSKVSQARAPELILHLLAAVGGFPGGWLGRFLFNHKTNVRKHPAFLIVLFLSTVGHGLLTWYWFLRGS